MLAPARVVGEVEDVLPRGGRVGADGEGAHAVEGRGLAIDGNGGRPGGAPGELALADLIRDQRGGPRVAAEEGDEMGVRPRAVLWDRNCRTW